MFDSSPRGVAVFDSSPRVVAVFDSSPRGVAVFDSSPRVVVVFDNSPRVRLVELSCAFSHDVCSAADRQAQSIKRESMSFVGYYSWMLTLLEQITHLYHLQLAGVVCITLTSVYLLILSPRGTGRALFIDAPVERFEFVISPTPQ